jgi:hypothetical protein
LFAFARARPGASPGRFDLRRGHCGGKLHLLFGDRFSWRVCRQETF